MDRRSLVAWHVFGKCVRGTVQLLLTHVAELYFTNIAQSSRIKRRYDVQTRTFYFKSVCLNS
jgi:hypothetical protein